MPETPAQPTQAPAPRHHGHAHGEAFCLMHYRSEDGTADEWIWNSRDGVTPFMVHTADGMKVMQHVEWRRDKYAPSYVPAVGSRVFVDLTPERARYFAARKVELYWDDAHYPMRNAFPENTTRGQAVTIIADQMLRHRRGEPDLIEVTERMHLAFQKRADSLLLHRTETPRHN